MYDFLTNKEDENRPRMPDVQMPNAPAAMPFNAQAGNTEFQVDPEFLKQLDPQKVQALDAQQAQQIIQAGDFVFNKIPRAQEADSAREKARIMSDNERKQMTGDLPPLEDEEPSMMDKLESMATGFFGDKEKMIKLALWANSMRLTPSQGMAKALNDQLVQLRANKKNNATAAFLRKRGLPGDMKLAAMIENNPELIDKKTLTEALLKTSVDQFDKDQLKSLNALRDDLKSELSTYKEVEDGWNVVKTMYDNPGAVSDFALAVAFAKILDPGSVVREGEVQAVLNAGAKMPMLKQALVNAINAEGMMPDAMRNEIVKLASAKYRENQKEAITLVNNYERLANKAGYKLEDILMGSKPDPASAKYTLTDDSMKQRFPTPPGFNAQSWSGMSKDEKQKYLRMTPQKQVQFIQSLGK